MKRLLIGGLAAVAIGLAAAPVAGADSNDRAFIKSTDEVIMLHTGSDLAETGDGKLVETPGRIRRLDSRHRALQVQPQRPPALPTGAAFANGHLWQERADTEQSEGR